MIFLSKYGRFVLSVQREIVEAYASGLSNTVQRGIYATFHEGGLSPEERELAVSHWVFEGSYQNMDEVTTVPPDYRIGRLDTEAAQLEQNWTDEMRLEVERQLIRHSERFEDVLVVPAVFIPPPWPRYDEFTGKPAALVRKLVDEGHNLDATLTYERAMQKRPEVIEAIEAEIAEPAVEVEEEVVG